VGRNYRFRCKAAHDLGTRDWSAWLPSSTAVIVGIVFNICDRARRTTINGRTSISNDCDSAFGAEIDFRVSYVRPSETGSGDSAWPILSYAIVADRLYESNLLGHACNILASSVIVNGPTSIGIVSALTTGCTYCIIVRAKECSRTGLQQHLE